MPLETASTCLKCVRGLSEPKVRICMGCCRSLWHFKKRACPVPAKRAGLKWLQGEGSVWLRCSRAAHLERPRVELARA